MEDIIVKRIKIPIYFGDLILIQLEHLSNIPEKYKIDFDTYGFDAITYHKQRENGYDQFIIVVAKDVTHKIIAHEAFHCMNWIFHLRNIGYTINDNDEHAAYLIGWIVDQCCKYLKIK